MDKTRRLNNEGIPTVDLSGNPLFKEFLVDMAVLPKHEFMRRHRMSTDSYWELFFQFDLDELEEVVRKSLCSFVHGKRMYKIGFVPFRVYVLF